MMRRPPPPAPRRKAPPPAQRGQSTAAAPAQQSGGMMSGLMGTMAQGMAFGAGSSMARQAVGSLFGGGSEEHAAQPAAQTAAPASNVADACAVDKRAFYQCLETSNGDAGKCDEMFRALSSCQENAKWASA
jgi:hypothetical protein